MTNLDAERHRHRHDLNESNPLRYRTRIEQWRAPIEKLQNRVWRMRKRFGRGLGRNPSHDEREAMLRAARLRVVADYALSDPTCDANSQVRLVNAADRAVAAMTVLLGKKPHRDPDPDADHVNGMVIT